VVNDEDKKEVSVIEDKADENGDEEETDVER